MKNGGRSKFNITLTIFIPYKFSKIDMKNPDRESVSRLEELPNIGKAIASDLHLIGIDHPKKLLGIEPFSMYEQLCMKTGKRHDPCLIDVFMSVVHFMEGGDPLPWWSFTPERKKRMARLSHCQKIT